MEPHGATGNSSPADVMGGVLESLRELIERTRTLIIQAAEERQGEPREIVDVFWLMKDLEERVAGLVVGFGQPGDS